jgi:hypothetical protein
MKDAARRDLYAELRQDRERNFNSEERSQSRRPFCEFFAPEFREFARGDDMASWVGRARDRMVPAVKRE